MPVSARRSIGPTIGPNPCIAVGVSSTFQKRWKVSNAAQLRIMASLVQMSFAATAMKSKFEKDKRTDNGQDAMIATLAWKPLAANS
eukprot:6485026-Amphidinium_carterae.3